MANTKTQNKTQTPEEPARTPLPDLAHVTLSSNAFFGAFLSLAFVLSALLAGASYQVGSFAEATPVPVKSVRQAELEHNVSELVEGYPMERMLPYILAQDPKTAAYLVGIAKKESNWGKRVPTKDGQDCFNYWGYRGPGSRGTAMGHGCFGSEAEAVSVTSTRLKTFLYEYQYQSPSELVVWKCGYTCAGHSPLGVKKWISDVGYYADQATPKTALQSRKNVLQ